MVNTPTREEFAALERELEACRADLDEERAHSVAMREVLRVIGESDGDLQPVFDAITERAIRLCRGDMGALGTFDGEFVHLASYCGVSPAAVESMQAMFPMAPGDGSMVARAVGAGAPVNTVDVQNDPGYGSKSPAYQGGLRGALGVPMLLDGVVIGSIAVARATAGKFSDKQVELLQTFADQAVIAVENVRLFNETQDALERQTAISDVLRVISESPTDVQPVFDAIEERALALCNADQGVSIRFDGELMHLANTYGLSPAVAEETGAMFPMKPSRQSITGRAVISCAPAQSPDTQAETGYMMQAAAREIRSLLAVPLIREGHVLGAISVGRKVTGYFPDKIVSLLQTFADQAVIAIENVRLFRETEDALEQQTALSDVLRVITESPSEVGPVLEALADHAARSCDAASASIFLTEGDNLRHVTWRGEGAELAMEAGLLPIDRTSTSGRAVLNRQTVHVEDIQSEAEAAEYPRGHELAHRMGHRTIVVAPLLREGRAFGTILLRRLEVRPFSDRELNLLRTFGDQAAIALENARLFNETKEALEQQIATAEVLQVISSSVDDAAPVFEKILDSCDRLFRGENLAILLIGDDGLAHVGALRGPEVEGVASMFPLPIEQTAMGAALDSGTLVHYPDFGAVEHQPAALRAMYERVGSFSSVIAPMLLDGRAIGTISVNRFPPRPFSDKEISVLTTFADQAVIAIENARLFNETKEALDRQTATAEVLRVIGSSVEDTAPVFEAILDSCRHLFGSEEIMVLLEQGDGTVAPGAYRSQIAVNARRPPEFAHGERPIYPLPADDSAHGLALAAGGAVYFPSVAAASNATTDMRAVLENSGDHSIIVAPMMREGRGIGSLIVGQFPPRPFTEKEIALLTTFADQAVIAIENARLFNETKEALDQQTATAEVLRVISSSVSDSAPVFEKILDSCERLFATDQLAIMLLDDEEYIKCAAVRGSVGRTILETGDTVPLGNSYTAQAIAQQDVIHVPDIATLDEIPEFYQRFVDELGSFTNLVAPMLWKGRGVGSIVMTRRPPRPFSEKEIALVEAFADQAVIAIENARLFHEIEDKSHELEVANQHKSEFLANMSHELRTPLNAIIGFSEVLIERMFGELNEKQDDYLKDIYGSGKHLLALINDILDLSKIEAGRMDLELETFDIENALSNAMTLIRERAQQHGIATELVGAEGLGDICADQRKLKQVMLNLLSNAVKFTPDGGSITVSAAMSNGVLEISVADTGIGIEHAEQETIFQEFRQAGGDYTNKQEGTGLGLTLTKRFVELHGGQISVDSEPGHGATFTFTLPGQS